MIFNFWITSRRRQILFIRYLSKIWCHIWGSTCQWSTMCFGLKWISREVSVIGRITKSCAYEKRNQARYVACRDQQMWKKKHFVKKVTSLATVLFKMTPYICIYFVFTKKTFKLFKNWYIKLHHLYFNDFDMPFKNMRHSIP